MTKTGFVLALFLAAPVLAQQAPARTPELIDRIVAVVGDSIVLDSEVLERLDLLEARGQRIPRSDSSALAALRRQIIEEMADQLVLLQAAQRDTTIKLNEAQLNAQAEGILNQRRAQMGPNFDIALQQQRLTLSEYQQLLLQDVRRQTLVQQYVAKVARDRKPPPISEKELREIFNERKAALPARPPTIAFRHVVMPIRGSDSARAVARALADSLLGAIRAGEDFAALAKRFSDDPGSREQGGSMGWMRPSDWVKEFGDAVLMLRPGELSPVVETSYGYHIIQLEKVRSAERQVRHILITPAASPGDLDRALERGRQVADQIRAGADVDSLARAVADPSERVRVGPITRDQLKEVSPVYAEQLANAKEGDVVGPFTIGGENAPQRVVVVNVDQVREAGEATLDDPLYKTEFRQRLEQERLFEEIITELRRQTHIEIRP